MIYCLDTNLFIECWNNYYRNTFFNQKNFFDLLKEKSSFCDLYIHEQVKIELQKKDDELLNWFNENIDIFKSFDNKNNEIMDTYIKINKKYPGLKKNSPDSADPFIIASAIVLKGKIVSDERGGGQLPQERSKYKSIPQVCVAEKIDHLSIFDFIEEVKIKFN